MQEKNMPIQKRHNNRPDRHKKNLKHKRFYLFILIILTKGENLLQINTK